ncbi:AI-2E family transporter [Candidatus Woesebacteria bacterium]|nr:MAG: AI-2E family transporter [Candidatus Woesebacteria bacterium]
MRKLTIEISHKTIIFTTIFVLGLWLVFLIRDIILMLFVASLITIIMNPLVTRLQKIKIPRALSILVAYILVITVFGLSLAGVVPALVDQSTRLALLAPGLYESIGQSSILGEKILVETLSQIGRLPSYVAKSAIAIFSNILNIVAVLIFAFYMLLARDRFPEQLKNVFGGKSVEEFEKIINILEKRLGGWMLGQASLMLIIFIIIYVGLMFLQVPLALPLAIIAGMFEIVPYLGPFIAAAPAVVIGFGVSPVMALAVIALYFLVQQLENYLIVPKVMERSAKVNPIVTLLALTVGFRLAGIVGIFISVPVVIIIELLVREYMQAKRISS